jgi:hypothetical protein
MGEVFYVSCFCESGNLGGVIEPYVNNTTYTSVLQVRKEFFSRLLGKANSEEFHASTGFFLYAIFLLVNRTLSQSGQTLRSGLQIVLVEVCEG